ncbi:hypothetical protein [Spirosoma fluminis]
MKNKDQPFIWLLEQYAFSAIGKYIDQADSQTQTQLIKLYSDIYDQLALESAESEEIDHPLSQESDPQSAYKGNTARLLRGYHYTVESTKLNIQQMDELIEQTNQCPGSSAHRDHLLHHYQSIRAGFVVCLETTLALCQHELFNR